VARKDTCRKTAHRRKRKEDLKFASIASRKAICLVNVLKRKKKENDQVEAIEPASSAARKVTCLVSVPIHNRMKDLRGVASTVERKVICLVSAHRKRKNDLQEKKEILQ